MEKTIFAKILDGEIPTEILYQNERTIVIDDIHPQASIHCLVITKTPYKDISEMDPEDFFYVHDAIKKIAALKAIEDYRVVTNKGPAAGQTVFHLHFHVLGGSELGDINS